MVRRFALLFLLLFTWATVQAAAPAGDDPAGRIDRFLSGNYPPNQPGAAVLAARDGEVVFRGGYGLASMELQIPVRPEMVFGLASVTKLFTALGAMMLVEEGSLRLDDEVVKFLPQLEKTKGATIANLLSHTSGMTGPVSELPDYRKNNFYRPITSEELIDSYAEYDLKFPPGERFQYSNEGVATLARIIEVVTGESWEQFLQTRIFNPVGMNSTFYAGHDRIIPMSVTGYTEYPDGWKRATYTSFTRGFGMGALFSSVDDLYLWYRALISGQLVKPETLSAMLTPFTLKDGGKSRHGYGFVVTDVNGHKLAGHGGSHSGWNTFLCFLPDDGIFVTVLTNRSVGKRKAMDDAMGIIDILLGIPASPAAEEKEHM
jgi:CubicO group peptidase (beta-lactamase class C family)